MADQIQVPGPITPPQGQPPAPPWELVNAQIGRAQQNAQAFPNAVNQVVDDYYKKKQLQMEAFKAGGPYLMKNMFGGGQPPPQSSDPSVSSNPSPAIQPPATDTNQQGQAQAQPLMHPTSGLPQTIHDTHSQLSDSQRQALANYGINDPSQAAGMGESGQRFLTGYKTLGDLALQPGALQAQNLDLQNKQFEQTQQPTIAAKNNQELANAQAAIPMQIGGKSSEIQTDFNKQDQKIQAGFIALGDYYKALQNVPQNLKGSTVGLLTSKAGSASGRMAPELVAANSARNLAVSTLATALLPESSRTNPDAIREIAEGLPSVGDDPKVASAKLADVYKKLSVQHKLAASGASDSVASFGGRINTGKVPEMNFGTNSDMVTIRDSQGGMHLLPAQNLKAAQKRDPGLTVVSQ